MAEEWVKDVMNGHTQQFLSWMPKEKVSQVLEAIIEDREVFAQEKSPMYDNYTQLNLGWQISFYWYLNTVFERSDAKFLTGILQWKFKKFLSLDNITVGRDRLIFLFAHRAPWNENPEEWGITAQMIRGHDWQYHPFHRERIDKMPFKSPYHYDIWKASLPRERVQVGKEIKYKEYFENC